jgi:Spy/CpxP family protein refolding chaperone
VSIDAAFRATLPERRTCRLQLDALEEAVRRMMAHGEANDAAADALISRLEYARARRNMLRTMMLVRMYRVLSRDQRAMLRRLARRSPPTEPGTEGREAPRSR